jgi:hypothetical protein
MSGTPLALVGEATTLETAVSIETTQRLLPSGEQSTKIWAHVPEPPEKGPDAPPGVPPPDRPDEVDLPPREDPNKIDEPEVPPVPEPPMKTVVRPPRIAFTAPYRGARR